MCKEPGNIYLIHASLKANGRLLEISRWVFSFCLSSIEDCNQSLPKVNVFQGGYWREGEKSQPKLVIKETEMVVQIICLPSSCHLPRTSWREMSDNVGSMVREIKHGSSCIGLENGNGTFCFGDGLERWSFCLLQERLLTRLISKHHLHVPPFITLLSQCTCGPSLKNYPGLDCLLKSCTLNPNSYPKCSKMCVVGCLQWPLCECELVLMHGNDWRMPPTLIYII